MDTLERIEKLPWLQRVDQIALTIGNYRLSLLDVSITLLLLVALFATARLALRIAARLIRRIDRFDAVQKVLAKKLADILILALAIFVGIDIIGVDLTALTVFSGALGLAVGFGLQKTFGNLLAGVILLLDRSIKPGDVIVIGDSFGEVNKIGVRAVSVLTRDGKEHLIPNEMLMTEQVENWSYSSPNVRVHVEIGVAYDSDPQQVHDLLLACARESPRVLADPPPVCWLKSFGDNAVIHDLSIWIRDPAQGVGNVKSDVLMRVWYALKDAGIGIPFPQRDLYVKNWPVTPADNTPADNIITR